MTSLTRLLVRIGATLSRRGAWATLRGVTVGFGTTCLVLGLGALTLYQASVTGRTHRAQLIQPQFAQPGEPARLLVSHDGFTQVLGRPVTVVSLLPLSAEAPLPPGVPRWPKPGEAVLSPSLAADLATTHQRHLFGEVAGLISLDGLETPTERRVYLVPSESAASPTTMSPAIGYTGTGSWSIGPGAGYLNAADPFLARALIIGSLVLPAVVALVIGSSLDGDARRRRVQLLDVLGAGRVHRSVVDIAEALRPVTLGTMLGAAAIVATLIVDVPLPIVDARLLAADARAVWPAVLTVVGTAPALALLVLLLSRQRWRPPRDGSPFAANQTPPRIGWLTFGGLLLAVWWAPQMTEPSHRLLVYLIGLLLVAGTLPALMGVLIAVVAELAVRARSPSMLVSGRQLGAAPRRTARLTVGVCFAILMVGQAQLWQGIFGEQYHQATETRAATGNTVLAATYTRFDRAGMPSFLTRLPSNAGAVWVSNVQPDDPSLDPTTYVTATCSILSSVELPCSTGRRIDLRGLRSERLAHVLRWTAATAPTVRVSPEPDLSLLADESARLVLVSLDGSDLPVQELQTAAYATVSGGLDLEPLGQSFLTQGTVLRTQGTWIVLLGTAGVLIVVVALGAALAGDALIQARALAPLVALSERRRWLVALCLIRSAIPLTTAGLVGALSYLLLALGLSSPLDPVTPSTTLAAMCFGSALVVGVLSSLWSASVVAQRASTWTPGADL